MKPGSPEWFQRVADVFAEEQAAPTGWWWLSFTDPTLPKGSQFLGAAIVEARGMGSATLEAHRLGINPGGQAIGLAIPPEHLPPEDVRNRLLTRAEAEAIG